MNLSPATKPVFGQRYTLTSAQHGKEYAEDYPQYCTRPYYQVGAGNELERGNTRTPFQVQLETEGKDAGIHLWHPGVNKSVLWARFDPSFAHTGKFSDTYLRVNAGGTYELYFQKPEELDQAQRELEQTFSNKLDFNA